MNLEKDLIVIKSKIKAQYPNLGMEVDTKHVSEGNFIGVYFKGVDVLIHADMNLKAPQKSYSGFINHWKSDYFKSEGNKGGKYAYTDPDSLMAELAKWIQVRIEEYEEFEAELDDIDKEYNLQSLDNYEKRQSISMKDQLAVIAIKKVTVDDIKDFLDDKVDGANILDHVPGVKPHAITQAKMQYSYINNKSDP